jgi:hypothetical protein
MDKQKLPTLVFIVLGYKHYLEFLDLDSRVLSQQNCHSSTASNRSTTLYYDIVFL